MTEYCMHSFCQWIIIVFSLLSSAYFLYQYFKYLPYYNTAVSLTFGAMLAVYFWICLNALLTKVYQMSGQIIVILIGIPLVVLVSVYLRK
jgi:Ni/Fe-hydrogenase subunit HybB-like protein